MTDFQTKRFLTVDIQVIVGEIIKDESSSGTGQGLGGLQLLLTRKGVCVS